MRSMVGQRVYSNRQAVPRGVWRSCLALRISGPTTLTGRFSCAVAGGLAAAAKTGSVRLHLVKPCASQIGDLPDFLFRHK